MWFKKISIDQLESHTRRIAMDIDPQKFKFDLGVRARDTLTGFEGIIVYRTQWITNCNVYGIQPEKLDKEGTVKESHQFDEARVELIKEKVIEPSRATGGPTQSMSQPNRV